MKPAVRPPIVQIALDYPTIEEALAMANGNLQICKRQPCILWRNKSLARHLLEQIKHGGVQYLPGADLLFYHVEPRGFALFIRTSLLAAI